MNILFIPHPYQGLYKTIEQELIEQGHDVTTIIDPSIYTYLWTREKLSLRARVRRFFANRFHLIDRYWLQQFKKDSRLNKYYDLLFVIQGLSFSPILLDHLRTYNPNIKSSLYIWDSNRLHDFFHNAPFFDKVYSFDLYDVKHDSTKKIRFLPFFWPKSLLDHDSLKRVYDISCVGSCHDGRLHIFKCLEEQFKKEGISYFLKLYVPDKRPLTIKDRIYLCRHKNISGNEDYEKFLLSKGLMTYPFVTHSLIPIEETTQLMAQSKAILDTDRELQFGTTPRLIWALAENKHIYTTNIKIKEFPFYNEDYIHFIDRKHPHVDISLIRGREDINSRESVLEFRIDKWVKNFYNSLP